MILNAKKPTIATITELISRLVGVTYMAESMSSNPYRAGEM